MRLRLSQVLSAAVHAGAVLALVHFSAVIQPAPPPGGTIKLVDTKIHWRLREPAPKRRGGGGLDERTASKGAPPRAAPRQFVLPTTKPPETMPALPVAPSVAGEQPAAIEPLPFAGVADGLPGPPSDGRGRGGGIGSGDGGQVGDGSGVRGGGGLLGVAENPVLVGKVEPEFTEEARKARRQGVVVLVADIDEQGRPVNIRVTQPLGLGLDEKAVEAVRKWRFRPGRRSGRPVTMPAVIEVNFHLL